MTKPDALRIWRNKYPLDKAIKITTASFVASYAVIQYFHPIYKSKNWLLRTTIDIAPIINVCMMIFALRYLLKVKKINSKLSVDLSMLCVAQSVAPPIYAITSIFNQEVLDAAFIPIALFNIYVGLMAKEIYGMSYKEGYRLACSAQFLVMSPFIMILLFSLFWL